MAGTFRPLSGDRDADRWIPQLLPWVWEAGDPYYSWFFHGVLADDRPQSILAGWMRRRSSEVSLERAVLLRAGDRAVGGFIALGGTDLQACRRADSLAALQATSREGRALLASRIRQSRKLFGPVAADDFYLSKLWVAAGSRRAGHGARILREYLRTGRAGGFRRFRLDVCAQNQAAVRLYLASGFAVLCESGVEGQAGMTYLQMALEVPEERDLPPTWTAGR
jgi:ribosomal protein S18 acetylase RimI-like enzyme